MPGALDWLMRQLGGDPEAEGAAQTSTAMQPAVLDHLQNVLSDMPGRFGGVSYDSNRSLAQNAKDPGGVQQAVSIGMQVGPAAIRAYHGSPHSFDRFDSSKIGTGEGAQAFSHGLYFGGAEPVAETYIGPNAGWKYGNAKADTIYDRVNNPQLERGLDSEGWSKLNAQRGFWEKVALGRAPRSIIDDARLNPDQFGSHELDYIRSLDPSRFRRTGGHMYEVDLHTDPAQLLDWDKPLGEQGQPVQDVLKSLENPITQAWQTNGAWPHARGRDAYGALVTAASPTGLARLNTPAFVSQQLREAGIPGVKYLDQGSRSAGEGTSNYVMYDDKLIEILRKYGLAGLTAGAGGAAALAGGAGEAQAGALDRLRQQLGEPPT